MSADEIAALFVVDILGEAQYAAQHQRQLVRWREDPFELPESLFKKHFRLTKELVINLMTELEPYIIKKTQYDIKTKVLCALNFLANGSYQSPVGQSKIINMSQPSVSRCIEEVVEALNTPQIFGKWVRFPETFDQLNGIVRDFYNKYGFPGIIGVIDCTHVAIVPPASSIHDERSYLNRKNYHSINTQLICDANLKITNVNALFPGSCHDSHIWNNSNVVSTIQRIHEAGHTHYHLIGDSGYALRPWCLTPIASATEGTPQDKYNKIFKRARSTIERCNGVLKARFRCLLKDRVLHYAPNKATKIINACTVLHNICITNNVEVPLLDDIRQEDLGLFQDHLPHLDASSRANHFLQLGRIKQTNIVNNYFHN